MVVYVSFLEVVASLIVACVPAPVVSVRRVEVSLSSWVVGGHAASSARRVAIAAMAVVGLAFLIELIIVPVLVGAAAALAAAPAALSVVGVHLVALSWGRTIMHIPPVTRPMRRPRSAPVAGTVSTRLLLNLVAVATRAIY